jgi:hypothetical protein
VCLINVFWNVSINYRCDFYIRVILKQNLQRFFSADLSCESASHHFALFFFEMGSLEGFVILKLPQYFCCAPENLLKTCSTLDSDLMETESPPDMPPPASPLTSVSVVRRHLVAPSSLSTLSPCVVHRPLLSLVVAPPPLVASRRPSPSS